MFSEVIKPELLHEDIRWNYYAIILVGMLVALQIVAKFLLYFYVLRTARQNKVMIHILETHGDINEAVKARTDRALEEFKTQGKLAATKAAQAAVAAAMKTRVEMEKIPDKTAEKVVERIMGGEAGDSSRDLAKYVQKPDSAVRQKPEGPPCPPTEEPPKG